MRLALGTDWSFCLRAVSVQFSCSVVSDSLLPHGLQHTRLPCPAPTPRAFSNSWLHSQAFLHNLCNQGHIYPSPSSYLSLFFPSSFLLFLFHSFLCLLHIFVRSSLLHREPGLVCGLFMKYYLHIFCLGISSKED